MSEILELLEVEHPESEYQRMVEDHRLARHRQIDRESEIVSNEMLSRAQSYMARKLKVWG